MVDQVMRRTGEHSTNACKNRNRGNGSGDQNTNDSDNSGSTTTRTDDKTQPQLVTLLKENLKNLGVTRAALHRRGMDMEEDSGVDHGDLGVWQRPSTVRVDGEVRETQESPEPVNRSVEANMGSIVTSGDKSDLDLENQVLGVEETQFSQQKAHTTSSGSSSSKMDSKGSTALDCKDERVDDAAAARGDGERLLDLHKIFSAREEPSLLPLYPPGNPFLICNVVRGVGCESRNDAAAAQRFVDNNNRTGGSGGGGHANGASVSDTLDHGFQVDNYEIEPGGRRNIAGATGSAVVDGSTTAAYSSNDANNQHLVPAANRPRSTVTESSNSQQRSLSGGGVVLVRVPHQHFLRMPLSPSMISDHTMDSYRYGLAGLKERRV